MSNRYGNGNYLRLSLEDTGVNIKKLHYGRPSSIRPVDVKKIIDQSIKNLNAEREKSKERYGQNKISRNQFTHLIT